MKFDYFEVQLFYVAKFAVDFIFLFLKNPVKFSSSSFFIFFPDKITNESLSYLKMDSDSYISLIQLIAIDFDGVSLFMEVAV